MLADGVFDYPLSNPLARPGPGAPLLEVGAKTVCRISTIAAAIGLGSMAGIALPSFIAGVGLMAASFYTMTISTKIIEIGKNSSPEMQLLVTLAAAVFFVATLVLGISSFIWLSSTVNHIAAIALTAGIGYFGGWGLAEGGKRALEEFFKEKVDFFKIAAGSAVGAFALLVAKALLSSLGGSALMIVTTSSLAVGVISDRIIRQIQPR